MNKVPADLTDWMDQLSQDRDEWRGALFDILREHGPEAVRALLRDLQNYGLDLGVVLSEAPLNTPYINTIATFIARRALEQIVVDACMHIYNRQKVLQGGQQIVIQDARVVTFHQWFEKAC